MQFKRLFILLFVGFATLGLNAQENLKFPVSGTYTVQNEEGQPLKKYDKVSIGPNTFHIILNDQVLKYFRLIAIVEGGYKVEQYFPDSDPEQDKEKFAVRIDESNENECFVTLIFPFGTEQVHLIKN